MGLYKVRNDAVTKSNRYDEAKIAERLKLAQEAGVANALEAAVDENKDGEICDDEKVNMKRFLHSAAVKSTTLRALDCNGDGVLDAGETQSLKELALRKLGKLKPVIRSNNPA